MIEKINSPQDIKELSVKELKCLCGEIREKITDTVSENGGHLASNLGIVETTVAIHKVFDTPRDVLIFDVGHQCYAHKLITGRYENFGTLRKTGGISGFTNSGESEYDSFTEGHSGTSVSQALGVAAASRLSGDDRYVIALVGDGSFTNGMIYEALNNCRTLGRHLIIILNDNEMSISKNVGGVSRHLTRIRTSRRYFNFKHYLKKILSKVPWLGRHLIRGARKFRDFIKKILLSYNIFEALGVDYIGVADGNDLGKMINVLTEAKTKDCCTVVHIHTKKGKGYAPAETDPESYHSTRPFDRESGEPKCACGRTYSSIFGEALCRAAESDEKLCAVTAAMEDGTGLSEFKKKYPKRFFDVGIAEEHAVTFAAGLAKGGLHPVVALYSTFAQRTFDQMFHDVALQGQGVTLCLDRAGLVEGDGVTHQGIFDVAEFSSIPEVNIYSPDSFDELSSLLALSVKSGGINVIRYPKGKEEDYDRGAFDDRGDFAVSGDEAASVAVVTYGRVTAAVYEASKISGVPARVIRLKKINPLPDLTGIIKETDSVLFVEEGMKRGGIGEALGAVLAGKVKKYEIHALTKFVPGGALSDLMNEYGFTPSAIAEMIKNLK
ncbi:MAG: 1-deoxy-D-xylulose-5-phosphate synthase [Clostridia bacterium]|nr:1-deoxy-D-xylulose-5-phosphate synthase [Clostridia bacterium]